MADSGQGVGAGAKGWRWFALLLGVYSGLFLAFYPPLPGIEDEVGYINQALVWSKGAVSSEGAGYPPLTQFWEVAGKHVPVRQPGRSLAALPFLMVGGMKAIFLSGLLLHLLAATVGAMVLARLGHSPLWGTLLLFHPTLAIYSRAIMADESAGMGLLLALLPMATGKGKFRGIWSGLAVGFGALMRYHAGLALPFIALGYVGARREEGESRWRQAILCLAGGAASGLAIVVYNLILYHHPTDPNPGMRGSWGTSYFAEQVRFYIPALMVVWPGMLLAPILDRSSVRWAVRGACGFYLAAFHVYYFHDVGSSWFESAVVGLRLIQLALPIWIVSYACVLDDWIVRPLASRLGTKALGGLVAAGLAVLVLANAAVFAKHSAHLRNFVDARAAILAALPRDATLVVNGATNKLFGVPADDNRFTLVDIQDLSFRPAPAGEWYLALYIRTPADLDVARACADAHKLTPLPPPHPRVVLFKAG